MSRLAILLLSLIIVSSLLDSCQHESRQYAVGFYYWKTQVILNSIERSAMDSIQTGPMAVRYFDLDIDTRSGLVSPIAPVSFDSVHCLKIAEPVIFIKNRIFHERTDSAIAMWAVQTTALIRKINIDNGIVENKVIQLDCDWTVSTRDAFFFFIEKMKQANPRVEIISTVRLHQIKFKDTMGVPPVNRAVLMYYNMGKIECGQGNSILDNSIGETYLGNLKSYPLPLDWALPTFYWAIRCDQGHVISLISKTSREELTPPYFSQINPDQYQVERDHNFKGIWIEKGQVLKVEESTIADLHLALKLLEKYSDESPQKIYLFDLDSLNIVKYNQFIHEFSKH
ncbi:MAG: hypothetical protein ACOYLH_06865 [Flavobacteriales bacterium]